MKDPQYVGANVVLPGWWPAAQEVPGFVLTHWWVKPFLEFVLSGLSGS